ncbi:MAG TPA: SPW repeat protein [Humisphaera sp.]
MALIPTRVHAVYDYIAGAALIVIPWALAGEYRGAAVWLPTVLGVAALLVTVITRWELAVARIVPVPVHLAVDVLAGVLMAASPWLFGFSHIIAWPHVVVGLTEIMMGLLTSRHPVGLVAHAAGHLPGVHGGLSPR